MEEERGIEALVYLPVTEVLLPMEQAIELLAKRTYKSVEKNIDRLINELKERGDHTSARTMELNKYSALADMSSGGYSMEGSEVAYIFENMNQYSFVALVGYFIHVVVPRLSGRRNPGCLAVGYLLDLIDIVKPDMASREECLRAVSMLAESTADTNYILGAFFDDAVRGIGSGNMPYDLLLDTEQAARLRDEYLAVLSGQQYNLFMKGYRIKPHEMLHRIPRSLN